ncbi:peptidoglycan DD-metalloendopeptidase family protein [Pelotomaculum terephthalicicum JT]|uniref:peptidoglycan DD-metalloendopeptidase family protein n=1 Tax=Pelotomaculum terephthalicicum TaxID=206393 RepID=UPI001F0418A3|nr:peptidoglycan DD-metalloendopeptidase family protein [Pelotomaculum terephthalicicum]MCG9968369.1 peptidoglycan DD-metalloendopeptidase family protein [Pelotomaculum terephthalicicum JT]
MKDIKTKATVKDIKTLDKSLDVTRRAKNAFIRTKERAERTQEPEHDSYLAYAEDKAKESAEMVGNEAVHTMGRQGKKTVQKIKERRNPPSDSHHAADDGHAAEQTSSPSKAGRPPTRQSAASQGKQIASTKAGKAPEQYPAPAQAKQSAQRKAAPFKAKERSKRKYTLAKPNELAKRRFVQSRAKARFTQNREIQAAEAKTAQAIPSPVFRSGGNMTRHTAQTGIGGTGRTVRQSARSGSKAVKETAKGTIKTAQKSVKTAGQTAKTGVRTSQTAAKTAQTTAKAAQRSAQTARAAAKLTIHMAKLTVKTAAALTKGLIAVVGSGGAVLALFLIIIAVSALFASPFGLLFSDENKDAGVTPVSVVIQEVNEEYNQRIEEIKNDNTWDTLDVQYVGTGGSRGNIWIDILAVFAVKTALTDDGTDVVTIDQTRVDLIREVFWDMTEIDHWIETVAHTDSDGGTWYERILHIIITQRTAGEQAEIYRFNGDQREVLEDLLSGDYDQYFIALITGFRHLGDGTEVIAEGLYIWPSAASDYVTSFFGTRLHPILGVYKTHSGIDIGAGYGTAILAVADGVVTTAAYDAGGYGNYLIIDHGNGNMTLYAHMSQMSASTGQTVKQGQTIGFVGSTGLSTGPHLHFEIFIDGTRVDPLLYFSNYTAAW